MRRVTGHLPRHSISISIGHGLAGVGQASGEETAGVQAQYFAGSVRGDLTPSKGSVVSSFGIIVDILLLAQSGPTADDQKASDDPEQTVVNAGVFC